MLQKDKTVTYYRSKRKSNNLTRKKELAENKRGIYYGYIIVVAIFFIISIMWGGIYCFGVFFKPLRSNFGWTSTQISLAYSLYMVVHGLFYIVTGKINDRFGPRIVTTICGFFLGAGYLLMSRINALWQLYIFYGLILAIGMSGAFVPLISTVSRWFVKKRSLMTGICSAGIGVGTMTIPSVANWLISTYGWRQSFIIIGTVSLVLIVVLAQLLKRNPTDIIQSTYDTDQVDKMISQKQVKGFSLRQAIWTDQFWILSAAYFGFIFYLESIMVHIVPHAINMGISPAGAAIIITFIGGASTIGRVVMGATASRIGNKLVAIFCFILITLAAYILILSKEVWIFHLFALIFGFGYGGLITMQSLLIADLFGLRNHGLIFGTITFIITIGGGLGPFIGGYIFDLNGSYYTLLLVLLTVSATGSVLISLLRSTTDFTLPLSNRKRTKNYLLQLKKVKERS